MLPSLITALGPFCGNISLSSCLTCDGNYTLVSKKNVLQVKVNKETNGMFAAL
jgi:hypothetical protein